jgi:hypothetical protein
MLVMPEIDPTVTGRDSYSLLTLEGHLFHASLTNGLTALRAASIHQKGTFYAAFFNLSIGLERLMKVVLVIDHMARNSMNPPSDRVLRQHGHDLVMLFDYLQSLPVPAPNPLTAVSRASNPVPDPGIPVSLCQKYSVLQS